MTKEIIKQRKAYKAGEIKIGDLIIPCAVLDNRERVVSIRGLANALGVKGGGTYWKEKKANPDKEMLPEFIAVRNLEGYIGDNVKDLLENTIPYTALNGQDAVGIKAEIIPRICDVWVRALNDGKLTTKQQITGKNAYVLLSAFAEVGITALVDEATGFQKEKDEYEKIVERYLAKELQPWVKTFGEDFYYQIYRLKGWDWNRFVIDKKNHPWAVANITNRIVYEKLPDGVLQALQEKEPKTAGGNRKHRLHQHLSPKEGQVHLLKLLGAVTNMMELAPDNGWDQALHSIDTRFPSLRIGAQMPLQFQSADRHVFDETLDRAAKPDQAAIETSA